MAHYGYARVILNNLFSGEIYTSLKGTEEIFLYAFDEVHKFFINDFFW